MYLKYEIEHEANIFYNFGPENSMMLFRTKDFKNMFHIISSIRQESRLYATFKLKYNKILSRKG